MLKNRSLTERISCLHIFKAAKFDEKILKNRDRKIYLFEKINKRQKNIEKWAYDLKFLAFTS